MERKRIIGLTGGIATGKTAIAEIWRTLGADIINADEVARQVVAPDSAGFAALSRAFPEAFINGVLDRRILREIVFNDPAKRAQLNAATHMLIHGEILKRVKGSKATTVVVEAPLLFEAGMESLVSVTVCAVCGIDARIQRICARDGCSPELAQKMIDAQMDNAEKAALCAYAIDTEAPIAQLQVTAAEMYERLANPDR